MSYELIHSISMTLLPQRETSPSRHVVKERGLTVTEEYLTKLKLLNVEVEIIITNGAFGRELKSAEDNSALSDLSDLLLSSTEWNLNLCDLKNSVVLNQ